MALEKQLLYVPGINPRVRSKCTSSWYSDATVMSSSCGKYCSILQDHTTKDVSAAMNGMENPAFREQVATNNHEEVHAASSFYDRHGRSWSRNSGVVYHLPTSNANHRWRFADSGFPGSMASHLILSSSFFQIPNLQTSPVLFPLLRLLVEAPPVLRHSGAVRAVVAIRVWSLCWRVVKISIIRYNWL